MMQHKSKLPEKISMKMDHNIFFNTMPCIISPINRLGVKLVSRYPERTPALLSELLLYEASSGDPLAIMDAEWITAMRTGAVAALAIKTLQKSTAHNYAFMGLGNTARATLLCLQSLLENKKITVKVLSYKDHAENFRKRFETFDNIEFIIVDSKEDFINGSDVIVSCVTAADDLIGKDEWFEEGVLVVPVHTRGFQNCDLFFDKIFVDDTDHVRGFKNFSKFRHCDEFANVLRRLSVGRTNDKERILAYNIGIALHDIYFASKIYEMLKDRNFIEILGEKELDKFWV
jgi:ornithine cyclodeaminase/alanine dehydrogenase-like protein (mu-crystallin family)